MICICFREASFEYSITKTYTVGTGRKGWQVGLSALVFIRYAGYNENMGKEQQIVTWIFMMLTAMKKRFDLSLPELISVTKEYGVVRFLADQYELLHYYDNDYIVDDVLRHIEEQGGDPNEVFRAV